MGLKVWLPLNGDLIQQGISDIIATSTNTTITTAGKIGECYTFNGSSSYIQLSNAPLSNDNTEFSFACWFKPTNIHNGCLFSNRTKTDSTGITLFYYSNQIIFDTYNRWQFTPSTSITVGQWNHLTFTYKRGDKKKLYLNGILINETDASGAAPTSASTSDAFIGGSQNSQTTVNTNWLNGSLNDIRIYDHCLSAAEVREISQGLILHYKLDYLMQQNLLTGDVNDPSTWTKNEATCVTNDNALYVTITSDSGSRRIYRNVSNVWTPVSSTFTVSFDAKTNTEGLIIDISRSNNTGTNMFSVPLTTTWKHYSGQIINTADTTSGTLSIRCITNGASFWIKNVKLERGPTESRFDPNNQVEAIIQDSSGYNHNGVINGSAELTTDCARYSVGTYMNTRDTTDNIECIDALPTTIQTIAFWYKKINQSNYVVFAEPSSGLMFGPVGNYAVVEIATSNKTCYSLADSNYTDGQWNHIVVQKDTSTFKLWVNGVQCSALGSNYYRSQGTKLRLFNRNYNNSYGADGILSDFRVYTTLLNEEDIKQLYQLGAKIDNLNMMHTYEFKEEAFNILFPVELSRTNLTFSNGLGKYTQANCSVTLTNQGYRIYRPPNISNSSSGGSNNMWGGLKIINQVTDKISLYDTSNDNNLNLQVGHTYIFAFHAKGQSSNPSMQLNWSNNMGYSGRGLSPEPTIILQDGIPENFQGEKDCVFIFTISDTISKICTTTYSSYVKDNEYLSYRHLLLRWDYTNTGELGTDIYLTDFRMYDITSYMAKITKQGQAKFYNFVEQLTNCKIRKNSELLASQLIEI